MYVAGHAHYCRYHASCDDDGSACWSREMSEDVMMEAIYVAGKLGQLKISISLWVLYEERCQNMP